MEQDPKNHKLLDKSLFPKAENPQNWRKSNKITRAPIKADSTLTWVTVALAQLNNNYFFPTKDASSKIKILRPEFKQNNKHRSNYRVKLQNNRTDKFGKQPPDQFKQHGEDGTEQERFQSQQHS